MGLISSAGIVVTVPRFTVADGKVLRSSGCILTPERVLPFSWDMICELLHHTAKQEVVQRC